MTTNFERKVLSNVRKELRTAMHLQDWELVKRLRERRLAELHKQSRTMEADWLERL